MTAPRISVGLTVGSGPPLVMTRISARMARVIGAESLWLVDHLTGWFPPEIWTPDFTWLARREVTLDSYYDWQTLAGFLAARAGKTQIGVGVTEAIRRHPVVLAQAALSLSHMTRRPPILGIGAGEAENVLPYGLPFEEPVARLEEALAVLRMCLDSRDPIDFEGRFFHLDGARLPLEAGPGGGPRIWVAAHGPRMLELTGRFGDGWYPALPMTPEDYGAALHRIQAAARAAGRDPGRIVPSFQAFVVVGPTEGVARSYLEHRAVRFMALLAPDRLWRRAGLEHPLGEGFRGMVDFVPTRYSRGQIEAAIDVVSPDLMASQVLWGTPAHVVEGLRRLGEAGLRHVVLAPISALVSRRAAIHSIRSLPQMVRRLRSGS